LIPLLISAAWASSCCLPVGGALPGVLAAEERWGLGLSGGAAAWRGDWGLDGAWRPAAPNLRRSQELGLAAMVRVGGPFQLSLGLPALHQRVELGGVPDQALSTGDLSVGLRVEGPRGGLRAGSFRPGLRLGIGLPTSEAPPGGAILGADLGAGARRVSAGLDWESRWGRGPWSVGLDLSQTEGAAAELAPMGLVGWSLSESVDLHLLLSPTVSFAGRWGSSLGLQLPVRPRAGLRLIPSVSAAPPLSGLGRERQGWMSARLVVVTAATG